MSRASILKGSGQPAKIPSGQSQAYQQGVACLGAGRVQAALDRAKQAVLEDPSNRLHLHLLGQCLLQMGRAHDCIEVMKAILSIESCDAMAANHKGVAFEAIGRLEDALTDYEYANRIDPDYADATLNLAACLEKLGRFEEAGQCYLKLSGFEKYIAVSKFGWANCAASLGQLDQAMKSLKEATESDPGFGLAWYNLGLVQLTSKDFIPATHSFSTAASLGTKVAASWNNCGNAWDFAKNPRLAVECYDKAVAEDPNLFEPHLNKAILLKKLGQYAQAEASIRNAIELQPEDSRCHNTLGGIYVARKQFDLAITHLKQAHELSPSSPEPLVNLGSLYEIMYRHDESLNYYQRAFDLKPDYPYLESVLLFKRHYVCDWRDSSYLLPSLIHKAKDSANICDPFRLLSFTDDPQIQLDAAQRWIGDVSQDRGQDFTAPNTRVGRRLKVAYFSADFHNHATSHLMVDLFESHNRDEFEIFAFSFGPKSAHRLRGRVERAFDHFWEVEHLSDEEIASLSRDLSIDIAIDLKGFTFENRMGIFKHRAAPIQINYLGFPGTIGGRFIDYIIADKVIIPEGDQKYYSEKVIYTDNCYQCNDRSRPVSASIPEKQALGLPKDGFVFCCFNNNYKILPEVFDSWMRILKEVPGSVLWLLGDSAQSQENLRMEAAKRGVDCNRLVFAQRAEQEEHLARHRHADLFLDTFPCGAHTTASDALWMGIPVLTRSGRSFASRVASSLVTYLGCSELSVSNQEQYESLAISLANEPGELHRLRAQIQANRDEVFDTARFCQNFENILKTTFDNHWQIQIKRTSLPSP